MVVQNVSRARPAAYYITLSLNVNHHRCLECRARARGGGDFTTPPSSFSLTFRVPMTDYMVGRLLPANLAVIPFFFFFSKGDSADWDRGTGKGTF